MKNSLNLLAAICLLISGLLFVSCSKQVSTPVNNKIKAKIAPDRPIKDTFVVVPHYPIK